MASEPETTEARPSSRDPTETKSLAIIVADPEAAYRVMLDQDAEIERLREEVADLKVTVIAFGGPAMVEYAKDMGLPKGHLYPSHYDILKQAGARMDSFTRAEIESHGR